MPIVYGGHRMVGMVKKAFDNKASHPKVTCHFASDSSTDVMRLEMNTRSFLDAGHNFFEPYDRPVAVTGDKQLVLGILTSVVISDDFKSGRRKWHSMRASVF